MEKLKANKTLLKKILLIAWVAVCTAIFIYFCVNIIGSINSYLHIISQHNIDIVSDANFIAEIKDTVVDFFITLFLITAIYASFLALIIPKIIKVFRGAL